MALGIHLNVPGVRMPIRKERKSRLRLLDSDDEDYEKGERVPPNLWTEDPNWLPFQIVVRLFEDGWLHKNKTRPCVYRMFQIETPESLIQPYLQY